MFDGYCLTPRAVAELLKSYDSKFLRLILESNEKRKEEIMVECVIMEVEKVRKRVNKESREKLAVIILYVHQH